MDTIKAEILKLDKKIVVELVNGFKRTTVQTYKINEFQKANKLAFELNLVTGGNICR